MHRVQYFIQASPALPGRPSAVDDKIMAGDVGGKVTGQIGDRPLQILFAGHPLERRTRHVTGQEWLGRVAEDAARGDRIDSYFRSERRREPARELKQPAL